MVLPLEGVSSVAVILRFYRWRDALPTEGLQLCLPSLGAGHGDCGSLEGVGAGHQHLQQQQDREVAGWLAWGRARGQAWSHLPVLLLQVLVASPTTQVGRHCLTGLEAGTGDSIG